MAGIFPTSQQPTQMSLFSQATQSLTSLPLHSQPNMEYHSEAVESNRSGTEAKPVPRINVPREIDQLATRTKQEFMDFLLNFEKDGLLFYRDRIVNKMQEEQSALLTVEYMDMYEFSPKMCETIQGDFYRFENYLNAGLFNCVESLIPVYAREHGSPKDFRISIVGLPDVLPLRKLHTDVNGKLVVFKGTITRSSITRPELVKGTFQCKDCGEIVTDIVQRFAYTTPGRCPNEMCNNAEIWDLLIPRSQFADWQKLRVQEVSEEIPAGSLPRTMDVIVRGELCEKAKPGDTCLFVGTLLAIPEVSQMMMSGRHIKMEKSNQGRKESSVGGAGVSGLKQLGCRELSFRNIFVTTSIATSTDKYAHFYEEGVARSDVIAAMLTTEERAEMLKMIDSPSNYEDLIESICPSIYGHSRIKEGLLLLLLGGVHKQTPEGTNKLRGDINTCLVGDPGVSKSQFLKYVATLLPRGIYTSGKASSAAGLTASVVKDEDTGDFTIEAGALMLADNGICCIDEFDKMDIKDQVAIHEAMEQQTISIAKAGIHATLNARTSILAAANPIGGRYDKTRSLRQNVALSPPIMSRFDLFFVILDEPDEQRDYQLAKYILNAHRNPEQTIKPPYTTDMLRRFILFTRALKPRLTKSAMEVLVRKYQSLRQADSIGKNGYRITVRQLESLIRLSEAIARAHAESEVKARHVQAASILLQKSIIQRESGEINLDEGDDFTKQVLEQEEAENGMDTENAPNTATNNEDSVPGVDNVVKKQISMTEEEYMRLVRSVIGLLEETERQRRTEKAMAEVTTAEGQETDKMETGDEESDRQAEEKNDDVQIGLTFAEIREWYLNKIESSVHSLDDYAYQYRLVQKVLKRMIKVDRYLIVLRDADQMNTTEDQVQVNDESVLIVNPSRGFSDEIY